MDPRSVVRTIQRDYLGLNRDHFGDVFERVQERQSYEALQRDISTDELYRRIATYTEANAEFWRANAGALYSALHDSGAYGLVSHGAAVSNDFVLQHGLYFDSLLITDIVPLMPALNAMDQPSRLLAGHATNVLEHLVSVDAMARLIAAEADMPIVVIVPQVAFPGLSSSLLAAGDPELDAAVVAKVNALEQDAAAFMAQVFGLGGEWGSLREVSDTVTLMPARLANRHVNVPLLGALLRKFLERDQSDYGLGLVPAESTLHRLQARELNALDLVQLEPTVRTPFNFLAVAEVQTGLTQMPLAVSPVVWVALKHRWSRITHDWSSVMRIDPDSAVSSAFQRGLKWVRADSVADLLRLREAGVMEELRSTLRGAYANARAAPFEKYGAALAEFESTLVSTVVHHSGLLAAKRSQIRNTLRKDGAGVVLSAALAAVGWILPDIPSAARLAVSAAPVLVGGVKSVWELVKTWTKGRRELAELSRSPTAHLLRTYDKSRQPRTGQ